MFLKTGKTVCEKLVSATIKCSKKRDRGEKNLFSGSKQLPDTLHPTLKQVGKALNFHFKQNKDKAAHSTFEIVKNELTEKYIKHDLDNNNQRHISRVIKPRIYNEVKKVWELKMSFKKCKNFKVKLGRKGQNKEVPVKEYIKQPFPFPPAFVKKSATKKDDSPQILTNKSHQIALDRALSGSSSGSSGN